MTIDMMMIMKMMMIEMMVVVMMMMRMMIMVVLITMVVDEDDDKIICDMEIDIDIINQSSHNNANAIIHLNESIYSFDSASGFVSSYLIFKWALKTG